MIKKLCLMLAALIVIACSASAEEYITTYNDYITASHTIAAGDSAASLLTDTSNYQWYNVVGSKVHVRFRYKKDTVLTAAKDTRSVYIVCTPVKGDADSANLYQTFYTATDATPTAAWEYTDVTFNLTDSTAGFKIWKVYFVSQDSVTQAQETSLLGNTYADTLDWIMEVWK